MRFPAKKPRFSFGLSYLLIEFFYIDVRGVQTDGGTVTWQQVTTKIYRILDNQVF